MNRASLPVIWHEAYEVDIGPHVFPTAKYRLVRERLLAEGTIRAEDLVRPEPADDDQVGLVHTPEYLHKIKTDAFSLEERLVLEVPFSRALREAAWLCAGGSILAGRLALECGEGFCLINDVAIAIQVLRREEAIRRAAVIDCDVHQGNGTAAIFVHEPDVFTFSIHQERNYPAWKPPSDLDVGLGDGTGDAEYLRVLEKHIPEILERHHPALVFYLAGADPYKDDQLGGLGLTREGLRGRDELILELCARAGVPVAVTLAGGYALRTEDTVDIHCATVRAAKRQLAKRSEVRDTR